MKPHALAAAALALSSLAMAGLPARAATAAPAVATPSGMVQRAAPSLSVVSGVRSATRRGAASAAPARRCRETARPA